MKNGSLGNVVSAAITFPAMVEKKDPSFYTIPGSQSSFTDNIGQQGRKRRSRRSADWNDIDTRIFQTLHQ